MHGLYAIYDHPHREGLDPRSVVAAMVRGGATAVQLRAKHADTRERVALLEQISPPCRDAGVPLIVNDDLDAALAGVEGVRGVHLGVGDPGYDDIAAVRARAAPRVASFVVGLSTHDPTKLRAACRRQPDYVAFGPVGGTTSKAAPDPTVGFEGLLEACRLATRPVCAIGGLDRHGAARAVELGAAMVAMISGLVGASPADVERATEGVASVMVEAARPLELREVARRIPVIEPEQLRQLAMYRDDLAVLAELALPTRFRPLVDGDHVRYRPSDVVDLLFSLDKQPGETWTRWAARRGPARNGADLVRLRAPTD